MGECFIRSLREPALPRAALRKPDLIPGSPEYLDAVARLERRRAYNTFTLRIRTIESDLDLISVSPRLRQMGDRIVADLREQRNRVVREHRDALREAHRRVNRIAYRAAAEMKGSTVGSPTK